MHLIQSKLSEFKFRFDGNNFVIIDIIKQIIVKKKSALIPLD